MRMRTLLSFALIFALVLPLAGCHGSRGMDEFVMPETFDTSREYEITFWAKNDTNMTQVEIYHDAIARFEALYPNIHVNLRLYTDYGKIYNDVITNIATGTTPNVCITYPDHIATYLTGTGCVVALDELMADEEYGLGGSALLYDGPEASEIVPRFLSEGAFDGRYYALPFMRSTEACYVNKTFVENLGFELPEILTWDFVWEVSEAAMAQAEDGTYLVNGQTVLIPFIYKSTDNMMITMLRQLGADYSTDAGEVLLFNDATTGILATVAAHAATGAFSTFKISGYPANYLNAGQCIFAIDSTAGATWMGSGAPLVDIPEENLVEFETAVYPVPQFDPENPVMISQGPSVCIFNKEDPQEVLASWLFLQFLLTNEVQIAYSQTEGYVPVTTKAQESQVYQDYLSRAGEDGELYYEVKLAATRLLIDCTEQTFVTPVFNGSASLRDAAGHLIETVTKSVRRKQLVDETFIAELYEDAVALYRLDSTGTVNSGKKDLGSLPDAAVALIACLAGAWILIGAYVAREEIRNKKKVKLSEKH